MTRQDGFAVRRRGCGYPRGYLGSGAAGGSRLDIWRSERRKEELRTGYPRVRHQEGHMFPFNLVPDLSLSAHFMHNSSTQTCLWMCV